MDDALPSPWIDYDLFCRFSRRYRFHCLDQVLATYRLHPESKTERWTDAERLRESIALSRRHWGSPLRPLRWRLALSLALFRLDRVGRSRRQLRRAREGWWRGGWLRALPHALAGAALAPEVAFYVGVYPALREGATGTWRRVLDRLGRLGSVPPQSAVYLERTEPWNDGWVGPRLVVERENAIPARGVRLRGWADLTYMDRPLELTVSVDEQVIGRHRLGESGDFAVRLPTPGPIEPGPHTVAVEASAWFVPHRFARNGDFRPLAWRLGGVDLEEEA
jgi:hypothetical protein